MLRIKIIVALRNGNSNLHTVTMHGTLNGALEHIIYAHGIGTQLTQLSCVAIDLGAMIVLDPRVQA